MTSTLQQKDLPAEIGLPANRRSGERKFAVTLLLAYILLIWFGYGQLRAPDTMMSGEELSYDRSTFLAINAATLTGFSQAVGVNEFRPDSSRGPVTVLVLIVGGTLFTTIVGSMAVVRILRLPYSIRKIVVAAVVSALFAVLLGAAAMISPERSLFDSLFQSAAAFGNCGLAIGHVGSVADPRSYVLVLLALFGGLGLPVLMELYDLLFTGRRISSHSRTVLCSSAGIYLAGFLLLLILQRAALTEARWSMWQQILATSSVESINSRTAGMHFELIGGLPRAAQWVLILLMIAGANPASTGGGLKGTTIVQLFRGLHDALRGRPVGRAVGIALTWVILYATIVCAFLLVLMCLDQELPPDRQLFLIVSAASNVGLAHDTLSTVGPPLYLLSVLMVVARLAPWRFSGGWPKQCTTPISRSDRPARPEEISVVELFDPCLKSAGQGDRRNELDRPISG